MQVLGSWCLPRLGEAAEAKLPLWLIDAMMERKIVFNDLGGLSRADDLYDSALPGDTIILTSEFEIQFCPKSTRSL